MNGELPGDAIWIINGSCEDCVHNERLEAHDPYCDCWCHDGELVDTGPVPGRDTTGSTPVVVEVDCEDGCGATILVEF